jgi:RHS repeat-associated protein
VICKAYLKTRKGPFCHKTHIVCYYDTDLGLYYLNSRYYDSNTGRFISTDSVGYLGANVGTAVTAWAGVTNAGLALVGKGLSVVDAMNNLQGVSKIIFGTMTNSPLIGLGMAINMGISKHSPVYTINDLYNNAFGKHKQLAWRCKYDFQTKCFKRRKN